MANIRGNPPIPTPPPIRAPLRDSGPHKRQGRIRLPRQQSLHMGKLESQLLPNIYLQSIPLNFGLRLIFGYSHNSRKRDKDNNVSEGRTYYYKVKAFDSGGNSSDFSETVSVSLQSTPDKVKGPNKPVITSVTASRSGQLTIKWNVNSHPTCAPQQASSYLYPILKAAAPPRLTTWERTPPPSAFPMVCGLIRTDG